MKNLVRLIPFLILAYALTGRCYGADFSFSYLFGDGISISGTMSGTRSGSFVDNVSNVTLRFNGTPLAGPIFSSRYDFSSADLYVNGPVVSFNALENNFVFSNSDLAKGDFGYDSLFYMLNAPAFGSDTAVGLAIALNIFGSQDLPTAPDRWSLTPVSSANIPDGGVTFILLSITLAGLFGLRRQR